LERVLSPFDALAKSNGKLYTLFQENLPNGEPVDRVEKIFDGENRHGRTDRPRSVFVKTDYLPHDCVEIFFERQPLPPNKLEKFIEHFRKVWKLSPPSEPDFLKGEGSEPEKPPPAKPPEQAELPGVPPKAEPKQPAEPVPPPQAPPEKQAPTSKDKEASQKADTASAGKTPKTAPQPEEEKTAPIPPIDRKLFGIHNPRQLCWNDSQPLLDFGEDGSEDDIWRLKDACEANIHLGG
jgi:hypothetical protein